MKTLKFASHLVPLVLSGEKTSTWRLFDDKDLSEGDQIIFVNKDNGEEFARATLTSVREKKLGDITPDDYDGHEWFESREAMFETYRGYYGENVDEGTMVKMVTFKRI